MAKRILEVHMATGFDGSQVTHIERVKSADEMVLDAESWRSSEARRSDPCIPEFTYSDGSGVHSSADSSCYS